MALLEVKNLRIEYPSRHGVHAAVKSLSFTIERGEIVGVVGESGAGKSTVGNAVIDLLSPPGQIASGEVFLDGNKISGLTPEKMRNVRGSKIGFIFQDPMTSLNPLFTVEQQLTETIITNLKVSQAEAVKRALALMEQVGIPEPQLRIKQYPHQFSGGMRQRVVIAIALAGEPDLIIADEPTTALDVSIQDQILTLIRDLCVQKNVGCMLVTHDMGVVSNVTDRVAVMYRGDLVEIGTTEQVLQRPQHPYTQSLISAVPRSDIKLKRFPLVTYIEDVQQTPSLDVKNHWLGQSQDQRAYDGALLEIENVNLRFVTKDSLFESRREYVQANNDVSFHIAEGETFGLVGESGSGKSTIARVITGLYPPNSGTVRFEGIDLTALKSESERRPLRRQMQMVFQNPYTSMNPRMRVFDIIAEPIRFHKLTKNEAQTRQIVNDLLDHVGLGSAAGIKFPHEFSGGQRQRISIARALATRPRLLICDEPTSALDVSVQAQILNLLKDLQDELNLTMLFISHDLPVIRQMCDRIGVMQQGTLLEVAPTEQLFTAPQHQYSKHLISLMPEFKGLDIKRQQRA
ncbi:dipeptide ABC transporter ATP-binding protein [Photobacterium phosphoreum]|jgi:peptide/nickel transport system ATP-binding protein|uniref:dipeptide ABC transporter ATP-binding protein n=1 Tax=Photobacterium phosphoreum TaxID=659 RepID=UPI000D16BFA5|nr:ABC transporter ATP-binding protein [Photobacterium phosphoreum]MCD9465286.1 ABC transporter ATP-binding protein [Photobacterium phosphoreum]MCD9476975.1 dipeptide ABC transporter ATP-binding protein [Photobacterium phosphoreum]MCD9481372.1 dipeptide ABC transporter ATP-binding protein [Photobacterium phosphoreum]MCD9485286.1 dipeptide ABC transporter ATP-binding protein [Photobacterium phosphoreum]MCD9508813.1 dipeptide ABC transporter ATP-binding protein [Photobacterium phosphoreum]